MRVAGLLPFLVPTYARRRVESLAGRVYVMTALWLNRQHYEAQQLYAAALGGDYESFHEAAEAVTERYLKIRKTFTFYQVYDDQTGLDLLCAGIVGGNTRIVREAIARGCSVNLNQYLRGGSWAGQFPIHIAATATASAAPIYALAEAGADLNARHHGDTGSDSEGLTPVMLATQSWGDSIKNLEALLACGADPSLTHRREDGEEWSALLYALAEQAGQPAALLLAYGADVDAGRRAGQTPRDMLASMAEFAARSSGDCFSRQVTEAARACGQNF